MQSVLLYLYYTVLCSATIVGLYNSRRFDKSLHVILYLLMLTTVSEVLSYILLKNEKHIVRYGLFHCFNILQLIIICMFFIFTAKPVYQKRLVILTCIVCPCIGILNIVYLQPIHIINSNMLMFESFVITTLCLYLIYHKLKTDKQSNIFSSPYVQIAILFLISWSSTFFFWAFIEILYDTEWEYSYIIMHSHTILNILVYAGIAAVFFFHPKKTNSPWKQLR